MKSLNRILWGIAFVAAGVIMALKALDIIEFNFFRDGWWAFIIIIPSMISLITQRDKTGSIIGLTVGVVIILASQDIIDFSMVWKLLLPAVIIIIGLSLIFKDVFNKKARLTMKTINSKGLPIKEASAVFSSQDTVCANEDFYGAELNAVFGSVKCDLRGAYFRQDAYVNVSCIFGGMDIYLPPEINVSISAVPIFGGITEKRMGNPVPGAPTVYINGTCLFGGVDIK